MMDHQPYIPGLSSRRTRTAFAVYPSTGRGSHLYVASASCSSRKRLLDPFGFSPRLVLEAARAGYRVLVTVNNPITRFLLEMSSNPLSEAHFTAALADLSAARKGEERLGADLQSLYLTTCENCGQEIHAKSFLWRKGEDVPYARIYTCPHCNDSGNV